jgi:hypothetical protein
MVDFGRSEREKCQASKKRRREILDDSLLRANFGDSLAQVNAHLLHAFGHFVLSLRSVNNAILERVERSVEVRNLSLDCRPIGWTVVASNIEVSVTVLNNLQTLKMANY